MHNIHFCVVSILPHEAKLPHMRQINCWSYSAFSWTRLAEAVIWQVWNACLA